MKTYTIITSRDKTFRLTSNIFFQTDNENIDQLVEQAMQEIDDSADHEWIYEGEYEKLNDFLLNAYGYEITELRNAGTIDGVDFYM